MCRRKREIFAAIAALLTPAAAAVLTASAPAGGAPSLTPERDTCVLREAAPPVTASMRLKPAPAGSSPVPEGRRSPRSGPTQDGHTYGGWPIPACAASCLLILSLRQLVLAPVVVLASNGDFDRMLAESASDPPGPASRSRGAGCTTARGTPARPAPT